MSTLEELKSPRLYAGNKLARNSHPAGERGMVILHKPPEPIDTGKSYNMSIP